MWPGAADAGGSGSAISILPPLCFSTRPVPAPTWSAATAGGRGSDAWSTLCRLHAALRHVPPGDRALPDGHWKITTFVAGLRINGIIAPLVLDGPMTGSAFHAYVQQFLVPALFPGDVVVMDNLAVHKVAGIREAVAAAGASLLYLPPYSPDLNP